MYQITIYLCAGLWPCTSLQAELEREGAQALIDLKRLLIAWDCHMHTLVPQVFL